MTTPYIKVAVSSFYYTFEVTEGSYLMFCFMYFFFFQHAWINIYQLNKHADKIQRVDEEKDKI
jgi:hypothetical protein